MIVVGLTGGIASGKSSISRWFLSKASSDLTIEIVDADLLGHSAYSNQQSSCYAKLVRHFGDRICSKEDGSINRRELGSIVFSNPDEMRVLQSIVWPEILQMLQHKLDSLKARGERRILVVVEAAIMFEAKWNEALALDLIIVSQVDSLVAKRRLMLRNNLSEEDAEKRIHAQMTNADRAAKANMIVVDNSRDLNDLDAVLDSLWESHISPLLSA